jgi:hypothetical protein
MPHRSVLQRSCDVLSYGWEHRSGNQLPHPWEEAQEGSSMFDMRREPRLDIEQHLSTSWDRRPSLQA